jgi:hypothetical protein
MVPIVLTEGPIPAQQLDEVGLPDRNELFAVGILSHASLPLGDSHESHSGTPLKWAEVS